jgi:hypothetical protein
LPNWAWLKPQPNRTISDSCRYINKINKYSPY